MTPTELLEWCDWRLAHPRVPLTFVTLFEACFRIQREASEAAGRFIPLIVENVRGAQKWVGRAKANFGSYYLWGDVGMVGRRVVAGVPQFGVSVAPCGRELKQPGRNFHFPEKFGIPSPSFHGHADEPSVVAAAELVGTKNDGGSWFAVAHNTGSGHSRNPVSGEEIKVLDHLNIRDGHSHTRHLTNPAEHLKMGWDNSVRGKLRRDDGVTAAQRYREGVKFSQSGDEWFDGKPRDKMLGDRGPAAFGSKSNSRKAASAMIAKIPFPLAQYIARAFRPTSASESLPGPSLAPSPLLLGGK